METCKIHVKAGKILELFFYADQSQSEKVHTKGIKRSNPVEAKELLSSLKTEENDPVTKRLKTPQDYEEVKRTEPIIAFKRMFLKIKSFKKMKNTLDLQSLNSWPKRRNSFELVLVNKANLFKL